MAMEQMARDVTEVGDALLMLDAAAVRADEGPGGIDEAITAWEIELRALDTVRQSGGKRWPVGGDARDTLEVHSVRLFRRFFEDLAPVRRVLAAHAAMVEVFAMWDRSLG